MSGAVCRGLASPAMASRDLDPAVSWGLEPAEITNAIKQCTGTVGLLAAIKKHGENFNRIHVSAACTSATRVRGSRHEILKQLHVLVLAKMSELGAREVANVLHSTAKLHLSGWRSSRQLVEGLMLRATATADRLEPQGASTVMWALAKMEVTPHPALLEAVQRRATATIRQFNPQGVSNVLWALATMGVRPDADLLAAMQRRATATATESTPQGVSNVLWALATMGEEPDAQLLVAMQRRALVIAREFKPQEIVNLMWALATVEARPDAELLEAMQLRSKP